MTVDFIYSYSFIAVINQRELQKLLLHLGPILITFLKIVIVYKIQPTSLVSNLRSVEWVHWLFLFPLVLGKM